MKLLGLFLIRCVFTKKILGGQKLFKTGTRKNRGFPEHCVVCINFLDLWWSNDHASRISRLQSNQRPGWVLGSIFIWLLLLLQLTKKGKEIKKMQKQNFCSKVQAWTYARRGYSLYKSKCIFAQMSSCQTESWEVSLILNSLPPMDPPADTTTTTPTDTPTKTPDEPIQRFFPNGPPWDL